MKRLKVRAVLAQKGESASERHPRVEEDRIAVPTDGWRAVRSAGHHLPHIMRFDDCSRALEMQRNGEIATEGYLVDAASFYSSLCGSRFGAGRRCVQHARATRRHWPRPVSLTRLAALARNVPRTRRRRDSFVLALTGEYSPCLPLHCRHAHSFFSSAQRRGHKRHQAAGRVTHVGVRVHGAHDVAPRSLHAAWIGRSSGESGGESEHGFGGTSGGTSGGDCEHGCEGQRRRGSERGCGRGRRIGRRIGRGSGWRSGCSSGFHGGHAGATRSRSAYVVGWQCGGATAPEGRRRCTWRVRKRCRNGACARGARCSLSR